jgi:predicted Zn-dependent protease
MEFNEIDFEISFYEKLVREKPDYVEALIPLAEAYTRKGRFQDGLEIDKRLSSLCQDDPTVHYNLACSYALVGDKDAAVATLQHAVALGYCDLKHLLRDEDLRSLVGHPGFKELIRHFPQPRP